MSALFALVSCPNYTAEVLSWVGFSIMTQVAFSYAFTLVGFAQMAQWALDKHRGYLKSDKEYRKLGRKAMVPFLL
jgi:very-long-chain enoyl-CoA reductase